MTLPEPQEKVTGVPDREKVIKGLECCILSNPDDHARCSQCSYGGNCVNRLKMDALALLKEQEPVEPENENCPECGYTLHRINYDGPDQELRNERFRFCPSCGRKVKWDAADPTVATDINVRGKWVSCKDRMPAIGEKVLVYSKFGHVSDMTLQRHGGQNGYDMLLFDPHGMKPGTDITHWMPMPMTEEPEVI